jgi:hypothetical protein
MKNKTSSQYLFVVSVVSCKSIFSEHAGRVPRVPHLSDGPSDSCKWIAHFGLSTMLDPAFFGTEMISVPKKQGTLVLIQPHLKRATRRA